MQCNSLGSVVSRCPRYGAEAIGLLSARVLVLHIVSKLGRTLIDHGRLFGTNLRRVCASGMR